MLDFRLTPYLKLTGVIILTTHPPVVECHIVGKRDVSKERKMTQTLQNHAYITQLVWELMKWYFQASVGHTCYYSLTRVWQIVCIVYRKYANLFLCMPKITKAYAFMYIYVSPLHLTPCQLSVLGFPCFFTTHCNICFILGNVFHARDRKIPYHTLHQITHNSYFT